MDNDIVISLSPRGIVFGQNHPTNLEIESNVEVVYSHAFENMRITSLKFTKCLKKVFSNTYRISYLKTITFEEETDLIKIEKYALIATMLK